METALRALLIAGLPSMGDARINWGDYPGAEGRPYIVLHLISLREGRTMQGPDGLEQSRVQVDCYADTYHEAREIAATVKATLDHRREGGFRGILFAGMRQSRENTLARDVNVAEAVYRCSLDFIINWRNDHA